MNTAKPLVVGDQGRTDKARRGSHRKWLDSILSRRVVIMSLAVAGLAAALSGSAGAHAPGVTVSGLGTATIDGILSPGEWDGATAISFPVNIPEERTPIPGTLLVMNDGGNLYFAVTFARSVVDQGTSVSFEFDNDHDGKWPEKGDDIISLIPGLPQYFDQFRHRCKTPASAPYFTWCASEDTTSTAPPGILMPGLPPPGTNDGQGAFANDGSSNVYELAHPLDSADDAHDFSLTAGDTVGFSLFVRIINPWSILADTFWPSVFGEFFGDVVIASPNS